MTDLPQQTFGAGQRQSAGRHRIRLSVKANLPVLAVWLAYFATIIIVLDQPRSPFSYEMMGVVSLLTTTLPFLVMLLAVSLGFWLIAARKNAGLIAWAQGLLKATPWLEVLLLRFLPAWILAFLVMRTFIQFKPHIPDLNPFSWDMVFAEADRALLMGWDAWVLSHTLFPGSVWAQVFDTTYILWFYVLFACVAVAAVLPLNSRIRLAFLLTFALNWAIGGSLMAVIFSSAGPVYVQALFGDMTYAPLLQTLQAMHAETPLTAVQMIDVLWQAYSGDPAYPDLGISAFPSLHLGIAAMVACFARSFGRLAGAAAWAFALTILIGSVHLGWHYLVDGMAGIAMGWVFWRASLLFADWWLDQRPAG